MQKKKTALGNAARSETFDSLGLPSSIPSICNRPWDVKFCGGQRKLWNDHDQELGR
jgi:hypothetical protein